MISNNLVTQQHLDKILDLLDWIGPIAALRRVFQLKSPAAEEFSARVFTAAVDRGRLSVVRALLSAGVSSQDAYRSRTPGIETALAASVQNQHLDVVKCLVDSGADPNDAKNEHTPLFRHITGSLLPEMESRRAANLVAYTAMLEVLVKAGARPRMSEIPLMRKAYDCAEEFGHQRILNLFFQAGISHHDSKKSILNGRLFNAVSEGRIELVRSLVHQGADVECWLRGDPSPARTSAAAVLARKPLVVAVANKNIAMVELLLDLGADANGLNCEAKDPTLGDAFTFSCHRGTLTGALHMAAFKQNHALVKKLLERGADVSALHPYGLTPLHWVVNGNTKPVMDIAKTLLQHGADAKTLLSASYSKAIIDDSLLNVSNAFNWEPMAELLLGHLDGADVFGVGDLKLCSDLWSHGDHRKILENDWLATMKNVICLGRAQHRRYCQQHPRAPFVPFGKWLNTLLDKATDAGALNCTLYLCWEGADAASCITGIPHGSQDTAVTRRRRVTFQRATQHGANISALSLGPDIIPFLKMDMRDKGFDASREERNNRRAAEGGVDINAAPDPDVGLTTLQVGSGEQE